ncbi:hypothetical protein MKX64_23565 [Paenibacillus sp. FSL M8-0334]|uniref:hypothetical protein n=1 Tax=Paenibacillus sp. FSL M8-0334 TaxID=2921623 RepID=UPI0030FB2D02
MTTRQILFGVLLFSLLACALIYAVHLWLTRRSRGVYVPLQDISRGEGRSVRNLYRQWLQLAYRFCLHVPLVKGYVMRLRQRISVVHPYDEISLRLETMKLAAVITGTMGITALLLIWSNPTIGFIVLIMLACIVIHDLLIEMYVNRLERKLLIQSVELFSQVRHHYQQHGMVDEAIYEGAESAGPEIALHTHRIYHALVSKDPEEELEKYYESAPNRYLKAFAGISRLVMEFGDYARKKSSIYLLGLSGLTREIQLEILRRDKLDYLLKGLNVIALAPVFFAKPIERWARGNFPAMDQFYTSKLGFITKISIYVIIVVAYVLLQKLQQHRETDYRAGLDKPSWEERLCRIPMVRNLALIMAPRQGTPAFARLLRLLRESNTRLKLEWFVVRRLTLFTLAFALSLSTAVFLHVQARHQLLYAPVPEQQSLFGQMNEVQLQAAKRRAEQDRQWMEQLGMSPAVDQGQAEKLIEENGAQGMTQEQIKAAADRVLEKLRQFDGEYLKWWELVLAIAAGLIAYAFPLWMLYFHRKVRNMEMRHEVYQFMTVISILRGMERISVEGILEWLNRFAVIFKVPIQKCLLHYEHGAQLALTELKEDVWFPDFQRLVDKLLLAVDKVPIREVFDEDLDGEMAFSFEQRRQEYEALIDTKAGWGRMIGFAPMYALIFLYLVIPLIGMSFTQMSIYYEQIQRL